MDIKTASTAFPMPEDDLLIAVTAEMLTIEGAPVATIRACSEDEKPFADAFGAAPRVSPMVEKV